jgi:hypothetical protein
MSTHEEQPLTETERAVLQEMRSGTPVYFNKPCLNCGGPIWIRCTSDVHGFATEEDMRRSHGHVEEEIAPQDDEEE